MHPAKTLLMSLALTACAAGTAHTPLAPGALETGATLRAPAKNASSRIGPPSLRGMSLRRVDRSSAVEPPIALY